MKIKLKHTVVYDTNDSELWSEFVESQGDYPLVFTALEEFLVDRFINPNFDTSGRTTIEIVE